MGQSVNIRMAQVFAGFCLVLYQGIMVHVQVLVHDGFCLRDGVKMLHQKLRHGNAFGQKREKQLAVGDSVAEEIVMGVFYLLHQVKHACVEFLPCAEEIFQALRSCEGFSHRRYSKAF